MSEGVRGNRFYGILNDEPFLRRTKRETRLFHKTIMLHEALEWSLGPTADTLERELMNLGGGDNLEEVPRAVMDRLIGKYLVCCALVGIMPEDRLAEWFEMYGSDRDLAARTALVTRGR